MTSTRLLLARHLMNRLAKRKSKGFTLIELLVVVVIIGILASVALPSFVGAQDKARNASVQSNARTVQMALEEYSTEKNGAFPSDAAASWKAATFCGPKTTYLPGGNIPLSPWATAGGNQTDNIVVGGGQLSAALSVAKSTPEAITTENTVLTGGDGIIPPKTGPVTVLTYGAISYSYHADTQYYVLYASGKKGRQAIVCASVSNAGQ